MSSSTSLPLSKRSARLSAAAGSSPTSRSTQFTATGCADVPGCAPCTDRHGSKETRFQTSRLTAFWTASPGRHCLERTPWRSWARDLLSNSWMISRLRSDVDLSQAVVREIHRRVLDGQSELLTPGEYRRGENWVAGPNGELIFTTPPSGDVPELMRGFVGWLEAHAELPAPILAALAHLEFVAIHPFNDGNGRTARAISRFLLVRGGYALDGLVSLDAHLDIHRSEYFAAIRSSIGREYQTGYDATPFVRFLLGAITGAGDHVLTRLRGLGQVQIRVRRDVVDGNLPPPMLDALVYAFINRSLRAGEYQSITGRTAPTTTRDLTTAVGLGYLVAEGSTRDRWYRLAPISSRHHRPTNHPILATTFRAHRADPSSRNSVLYARSASLLIYSSEARPAAGG